MTLFEYIATFGDLSFFDVAQMMHRPTLIMESNTSAFEDRVKNPDLMNNLLIDNIKELDANFFGLVFKDKAPGDVQL